MNRAAFFGFPAIFEKAPSQMVDTATGVAIYTCQVGADFRFKVSSGNMYKLAKLDGETERVVLWRRLTIFRRKGHFGAP